MQDLIRKTLHTRYKIERELGKGGMGAVYLATDLTLQRPVAIKVLPPELAVRPELRERFLRETRLAAAFSHPNIVARHPAAAHPHTPGTRQGGPSGSASGWGGRRVRRYRSRTASSWGSSQGRRSPPGSSPLRPLLAPPRKGPLDEGPDAP